MDFTIRKEQESDYRTVEELTREAFWDLHVQGCDEHYLVHTMRSHPDFIPELDFVAVFDNMIIGNIMYTRSKITNVKFGEIETLTFGPLSILPAFQRQGVGSALIRHSLKAASGLGYKTVIINGYPHNYCKHGFKGSRSLGISDAQGKYPFSLLVLQMEPGLPEGHQWKFIESEAYHLDPDASSEFDKQFPYKKKEFRPSQEEFAIACRSYVE
ncbi:MAG: N-acetyltransferase [Fibrobacter sp.]|nr:N-acetyltransferase [Fibrobacter sp.]